LSVTDTEAKHEREMSDLGEDRYMSAVLRARQKELLTLTPSGRAFLRECIRPIERGIEEWLDQTTKRVGRSHQAAEILRRLEPGLVALLTATIVMDSLYSRRSATNMGGAIGSALEDEWRFRTLATRDPELWRTIKRRLKSAPGPMRRRQTALAFSKDHPGLPDKWKSAQRMAAGLVCLEILRTSTGIINIFKSHGRKKTPMMVEGTEKAIEWLTKADVRAAMLSPFYMPTLDPPIPWEGVTGGGYLTGIIFRRPIARFKGETHRKMAEEAEGDYPIVLKAINRIQDVPWRVNEHAFEMLKHCMEVEGAPLPNASDLPFPPWPTKEQLADKEFKKQWRKERKWIRDKNFSRRSKRFLVTRTLMVAEKMGRQKFYYPHKLDFRGRVYPVPYWIQPQGPDVARALLEFDEGCILDQGGYDALAVHGANTWGVKGTLSDRKTWVRDNEKMIFRIYNDPIDCQEWHSADDPFQFLTFCLAYGNSINQPCHLPVHMDASNNGLQLFALLTDDRELAMRTNAIATDGSAVFDMYDEVAQRVIRTLRKDPHPYSKKWLEIFPGGVLPRECAKRPVMTLAYGVTLWSAQDYVTEWYLKQWEDQETPFGTETGKACRHLAKKILEEVRSVCAGAVACMNWLTEVTDLVCQTGRKMQWTAPTGWPVRQEYAKYETRRLNAMLGGTVRRVRLRREGGGDVDVAQQKQGISPNFIHHVDAAIMALAVSNFDGPISVVHDSFATLANLVPDLGRILRDSVATIVGGLDGREKPLLAFRNELRRQTGLALPDPPNFGGDIQLDEIRKSTYLFS